MRQCILNKNNRWQTAWIPKQFAVKGKYLRILDEDGWQVKSVGTYQEKVEAPHGYFAGGVFH
jgi:hypothetical protein